MPDQGSFSLYFLTMSLLNLRQALLSLLSQLEFRCWLIIATHSSLFLFLQEGNGNGAPILTMMQQTPPNTLQRNTRSLNKSIKLYSTLPFSSLPALLFPYTHFKLQLGASGVLLKLYMARQRRQNKI